MTPRTLLLAGAVALVVGLLLVVAWWLLTTPVLVVEAVDGQRLTVRGEATEAKLADVRTALQGDLAAEREPGRGSATRSNASP